MGFWPLGDESIANTVGKERDTDGISGFSIPGLFRFYQMFIWYYVLAVVLVSMFERALIAQTNLLRTFVGLTVFMLLEFL